MHYAYIYTDPSRNDMPIYVGKGNKDRCSQHLRPSVMKRYNKPFYNKLNQMVNHAIAPDITKIECSSSDIAFELERGLIKCLGRKVNNTGSLLNLSEGGKGPNGKVGSWDHINKSSTYKNPMQDKHHKDSSLKLLHVRAKEGFAKGRVNPMTGVTPKSKGQHWYNNGLIELLAFKCPDDFSPGRLPKSEQTITKIKMSLIGNTRRRDYETTRRNSRPS